MATLVAPETPSAAAPTPAPAAQSYDTATIMAGIYGDGIIGHKGAFAREWVADLHEDVMALYAEALQRPGGALGRGPNRHYVEIHPERIRGFVDLVTHPWVVAVSEAVLGPDYKFVEIGFDVPNPGAVNQPWHRDFPAPDATLVGRRLGPVRLGHSRSRGGARRGGRRGVQGADVGEVAGAVAAAGAYPLLDDAVAFVADRLLDHGDRLAPAYTVQGTDVPDQRHVELAGYPGGYDIVGNWVNRQFQLDAFGEALLLFAAAARRGRLDDVGRKAADVAADAVAAPTESAMM